MFILIFGLERAATFPDHLIAGSSPCLESTFTVFCIVPNSGVNSNNIHTCPNRPNQYWLTFGLSRLSLNNSHISWCVGAHSLTLIWWCMYVGGHSLIVIVRPSVMDAPPLLFLRIIYTDEYTAKKRRRGGAPHDNSRDSSIKNTHESHTRSNNRPKVTHALYR